MVFHVSVEMIPARPNMTSPLLINNKTKILVNQYYFEEFKVCLILSISGRSAIYKTNSPVAIPAL